MVRDRNRIQAAETRFHKGMLESQNVIIIKMKLSGKISKYAPFSKAMINPVIGTNYAARTNAWR